VNLSPILSKRKMTIKLDGINIKTKMTV
jgi:hypothetical protein